MHGTKIHIIHAQGHPRAHGFIAFDTRHGALTMNALLPEAVIGGQFDFNRDDLTDGG